jgi:hypothetical protein
VTKPNRVNPWGQVIESHERGYFMGNRDYGDAWITCSLRHPDGSTGPSPVAYRKLFFLDEATALAAGHRPCAQCRRKGERGDRRRLTECQAITQLRCAPPSWLRCGPATTSLSWRSPQCGSPLSLALRARPMGGSSGRSGDHLSRERRHTGESHATNAGTWVSCMQRTPGH